MMNIYDLSIGNYKRIVAASLNVMAKGADYCEENDLDVNTLVDKRLVEDMASLTFQVNSIRHHSLGAIEGILAGEFSPPPKLDELNYTQLTQYLSDALIKLDTFDQASINALAGKPVYFRMNELEIPFTVENFIQSFSLPNLYFHATTLYNILRIEGVALGKRDFLGQMQIGLAK